MARLQLRCISRLQLRCISIRYLRARCEACGCTRIQLMSSAPLDRVAAGYDLPYLEQIKYAIRSMPYGDLMHMTQKVSAVDKELLAKRLWEWANANETEKEQTAER